MKKIAHCISTILLITIFSCTNKETKASAKKTESIPEKKIETEKEIANSKNIYNDELWDNWDPETETNYKKKMKNYLTQKGLTDKDAIVFIECTIAKMKEQNLKPNAGRDPKNTEKLLIIAANCSQMVTKK